MGTLQTQRGTGLSPEGFLQYLQEEAYFSTMSGQFGFQQIKDLLAGGAKFLSMLKSELEDKLLKEDAQRIGRIPFGFLPSFDGNAFAVKVPSGGAIACIDFLLSYVLERFHSAIIRTLFDPQSALDDICKIVVAFENRSVAVLNRTVSPVQTGFDQDLNALLLSHMPSQHKAMAQNEGTRPADFVRLLKPMQYSFLIAHEATHAIKGHLDDGETISRQVRPGGNVRMSVYRKSQTQEYEADMGGFDGMVLIWKGTEAHILLACEYLFMFLALWETIFPVADTLCSTHPPAVERLNKIRSRYRDIERPEFYDGICLRSDLMREGILNYTKYRLASPHGGGKMAQQ